jgi:hypothetical protein
MLPSMLRTRISAQSTSRATHSAVRPLPVPEPEGSVSRGLEEPFAAMVRVRDDLEDCGLATGHFFSLSH